MPVDFAAWDQLQAFIANPINVLLTAVPMADLVHAVVKQSTPYLLAPYIRFWKESQLLLRTVRTNPFSPFGNARFVVVNAVKARRVDDRSSAQDNGGSGAALDLLLGCLMRNEPVMLLGEPGAGKTTVTQAITYKVASKAGLYNCFLVSSVVLLTGLPAVFGLGWVIGLIVPATFVLWEPLFRRSSVPLFVDARRYAGGDVKDWRDKLLKERLGERPLLLGWGNRVVFILDGINEVQKTHYGTFVEGWAAILNDAEQQKQCRKLIFTTRIGEQESRLAVKHELRLCELDDSGVEAFLRVYGANGPTVSDPKKSEVKGDFDRLRKNGLLRTGGIGRNPYWLRMLVESGLSTANRGALFLQFAQKVINRELDTKPAERNRKPDWKDVPLDIEMQALGGLALAMHEDERIGFSGEDAWSKAEVAITKTVKGLPVRYEDVLWEAEAATLLQTGRIVIEFRHQLIQEFFVAYRYSLRNDISQLGSYFDKSLWWQPIFMLGGLPPKADSECIVIAMKWRELFHNIGRRPMAKGYWTGRVDVKNDEGFKPYMAANSAIFKEFGGRFRRCSRAC